MLRIAAADTRNHLILIPSPQVKASGGNHTEAYITLVVTMSENCQENPTLRQGWGTGTLHHHYASLRVLMRIPIPSTGCLANMDISWW